MKKYAMFCLVAPLLTTAALAETPTTETMPNALQPSGPWHAHNTEAECQLSREFGSRSNGLTFHLAQGAGPGRYDAILAGTAIPKLPKGLSIELRLTPQSQMQVVAADSASIPKHKERFVRWFDADSSFLQSLESSQQLTLTGSRNFAVTLNLRGIRAAIDTLRTCHASLQQSWGVDIGASKALATLPSPDIVPGGGNPGTVTAVLIRVVVPAGFPPPRSISPRSAGEPLPVYPPGAWVSSNDYPTVALRQGVSGAVTMALELNSAGRVENCRVVVSSKFELLDQTSCKVLSERAIYTPARLANGDPVASTVIERVRWQMPQL